jgi:putative transposase
MARGIEKREIFRSDDDRDELLTRFAAICEATGTVAFAWCLMPNHFHLVVRTGAKPLSTVMRRLLTGYAMYFNRRYGRTGHLFQNRYKSIVVDEERYFLGLVRYVHLNPVRGGQVASLDELAEFPWSGHAVLLGRAQRPWQDVDGVLGRFGEKAGPARRELVAFMGSAEAKAEARIFAGGGLRRSLGGARSRSLSLQGERWAYDERVLGSGLFVETVLRKHDDVRAKAAVDDEERRSEWERLLALSCERCGVTPAELRSGSRRRAVSRARRILCDVAVRQLGFTAAEIGRAMRISGQGVGRAVAARREADSEEAVIVEELAQKFR